MATIEITQQEQEWLADSLLTLMYQIRGDPTDSDRGELPAMERLRNRLMNRQDLNEYESHPEWEACRKNR